MDALRTGTVEVAARRALTRLSPAAVRRARGAAKAITAELARLGE